MDATPRHTPPKDRPFDPAKTAASEPMRQLVAEVLARIAEAESRVRRRQAVAQSIHEAAVAALVCDLVHRALREPQGWLTVELSNTALALRTRRAPFLTEQFRHLVRAMVSHEVAAADLQLGHRSPFGGIRSTIRASAWLNQRIDDFTLTFADIGRRGDLLGDPLVLRSAKTDGDADELPVPDTEQARRLRAEMVEINDWIAQADLGWAGCDVSEGVDLGQRYLRRIFNDGSLDRGGRLFYGFWQDLKKAPRKQFLRIDGRPIASLDFAQMSVRLAYSQVGVKPPDGDLYSVLGVGGRREGVKQVLNALFAASKLPSRMPQGARELFPRRIKVADVIEAISHRHPALVPLFGTAQALVHQNIDSRVVVRSLLKLKMLGVVALPIHDCLLVKDVHASLTKEVLETAFLEETGVEGKVEVDMPLGREALSAT
jgi:hypothetical protein